MSVVNTTDTLKPPVAAGRRAQPRNRGSDPKAALQMIQARARHLEGRLEVYKAVEEAYDRVPPDSDEHLRLDGLGWSANVDWGGMESGVNEGAEIDYNLATQPETYVKFIRKDGARAHAIGAAVVDAMKILAEKDKELLDGWSEWLTELEMMVHNRRAHGLGIFHFPNPHGWHFRSLHPGNLITPTPKSKLNPDSWPWFAIKTEFEITDLLCKLEDRKAAETVGWKCSAIAKAIGKFARNSGSAWASRIWRDVENYVLELKSADLFFAHENGMTIPGYIFYVREWDGTVSEHFLTHEEDVGFLFSGVGRHQAMSDVLALFPLSLGQGYVERVRGYGVKMLPFHDMENRVRNHAIDVTWTASGMVLQGESGDDLRKLQEMQIHGPFVLMPDGLELQQQSFSNPVAGLLSLQQDFQNTAAVRSRSMGGADYTHLRTGEKSATQSRIEWQMSQGAKTNEVTRFYLQLSHFHRIRTRRVLSDKITDKDPGGKEARAIIAECQQMGVTVEDIAAIKDVKVRTIFGDGDPINQFLALMDLKEFYGTMTEDGKQEFRFEVFHSRLRDRELARRLSGGVGQDRNLSAHVWRAQQENAVFETADTRIDVMPDDLHLVHAGEHTVYAEEVYQRHERGILSDGEAFVRVARCDAHCRGHLMLLGQDRFAAEAWKDLNRRWADLRNKQMQLQQRMQAEAQQEQARQLEELRNPRPSVKEQETAMTEQLRRQLLAEESKLRMQQLREKHELDLELAKSGRMSQTHAALLKEAQDLTSISPSTPSHGAS